MTQVLQKAGVPVGTQVILADGSSLNVGSAGILSAVPDNCVGPLLNNGWVVAGVSQVGVAVTPLQMRLSTGVAITATEAAGGFNIGVASEAIRLQGEITDNETEVSVGLAEIVLPNSYIDGSDVVVQIPCAIIATGAAVNNGSTVDLEARVLSAGVAGSDLCATAAQTFAALDTWYTKSFTITGTTLVAGSVLALKLTTSIVDSEAGGGTLRFNADAIKVVISARV